MKAIGEPSRFWKACERAWYYAAICPALFLATPSMVFLDLVGEPVGKWLWRRSVGVR